MSAQDNLGRQFEIFRGLHGVSKPNTPVGMHWTTSSGFAMDVAMKGAGYSQRFESPGVVIKGTYSPENVETDTRKLLDRGWGFEAEKEVPLKEGTTVDVHEVTKLHPRVGAKINEWPVKRYRKRKYNPPRKMTV